MSRVLLPLAVRRFSHAVAVLVLACTTLTCPVRASDVMVPGPVTVVPLDVSTVTTGGTAVYALKGGNRTAGGWIFNPSTATVSLCISETGVASGTTSSGATTCIPPGMPYTLAPSIQAVSVISSDSSHPFSGMGFKL